MKKQITIYFIAFLIASLFVPQQIKAQSPPQKMSYQAIIRDSGNALITSTTVGMQISILQGSGMGPTPVYVETQTSTSNVNGLVSLEVGAGTVISGTFSAIDWANGPFYIKTETDPAGGTNYTITGTSQLLSVPYALYSANGTPGPQGPAGTFQSGTNVGEILYWNGSSWVVIPIGTQGQSLNVCNGMPFWTTNGVCPNLSIGDNFGGGIIAYILQPSDIGYISGEQHGLIVAGSDQSPSAIWGCYGTTINGADGTLIGTGNQNTLDIINGCNTSGIAAKICNDLELNGYIDWYLPSLDELNILYVNRNIIGSFTTTTYWSSTEGTSNQHARAISFADGSFYSFGKADLRHVRAIRSF